ncbi:toll-like receptor 7 isoform X1 [Octopus sinensis]|uniref:Toll-like receptor 7 isoform X1 n=1 Tax=Octopus sinensis TaxID=2607531 RepID=A0A7E6EKD6_9MOLL|nr:toll-like receptor 7 isoform X1 [Octopus sinensis]
MVSTPAITHTTLATPTSTNTISVAGFVFLITFALICISHAQEQRNRSFPFRLSGAARTVLSFRYQPASECLYDINANVSICASDQPFPTSTPSATPQGQPSPSNISYIYIHCRNNPTRSNPHRSKCLCKFGNPIFSVLNNAYVSDGPLELTPTVNNEQKPNTRSLDVLDMDIDLELQPDGGSRIGLAASSRPHLQDGHQSEPWSDKNQQLESRSQTVLKKNVEFSPSHKPVQPQNFIFCQVTDLTSISLHHLKSLAAVDLGSNSIRAVPRKFFVGLANLKYISLSHNPIDILPDGVFCGLKNLTYLDLSNLHLSGYPSIAFLCHRVSPPIRYIDISQNSIETLSTEALTTLASSLIFLNLSSNAINHIHSSAFQNSRVLRTLDLSFNRLSELPARLCQGLEALRHLYISSNRIFVLHALPLINCTRLLHLDLSSNIINHIPQHLNLSSLQLLNLSANDLRSLTPSMFSAFPLLKQLDLSQNKIKLIEKNSISLFPALQSLNLSRNRLEDGLNFNVIFQHLGSLTVLDLSSNVITSLGNNSFAHLQNLEHLDLSHNFLSFFNRLVFRKLSRLKELNLRANMISLLSRGAFEDLADLQILDLSENDLVTIENQAFPQCPFTLNLSRNSLQVVPAGLKNTSIQHLDMRWNYIRKLHFQAFHDMGRLEHLQVGHNHIEEAIPGAFSSLSNLKTLSLDHNKLNIDFEENVFQGLESLASINLAYNNIHRLSDIFRYPALQRVQYLNISHNPIKSIGDYLFPPTYPVRGAIRKLSLDSCNITEIIPFAFNNLENLTAISLRDNFLTRFKPFVVMSSGLSVLLHGNPIVCSCEMRWLKEQQQQQQQQRQQQKRSFAMEKLSESTYHVEECTFEHSPDRKPILTTSINEFLCISKIECSTKCDCFAGKEAGSPLRTLCSRRLTTLPDVIASSTVQLYLDGNDFSSLGQLTSLSERKRMQTQELYLNASQISSIGEDFLKRFPELRVLRLNKNSMLTLPAFVFGNLVLLRELYLNDNSMNHFDENVFHGLRSLRHLDLSGNKFRVIEAHTLAEFSHIRTLRSIQLERNPWQCACDNQQFYHWLNYNYTIVRNRRDIRCNHKIVVDQRPSAFKCQPSLTRKIVVIGLIMSVIILAFCLAFFVRYRRECVACIYVKLGLQCCRYRDRSCRPFDIFLVYDRRDEDCRKWIESTLLPRLEYSGKHAFKIFYPDRNAITIIRGRSRAGNAATTPPRSVCTAPPPPPPLTPLLTPPPPPTPTPTPPPPPRRATTVTTQAMPLFPQVPPPPPPTTQTFLQPSAPPPTPPQLLLRTTTTTTTTTPPPPPPAPPVTSLLPSASVAAQWLSCPAALAPARHAWRH